MIVRKLKRLEQAVGLTVVDPIRDERGWAYRDGPGFSIDPINGLQFLSEAYLATDPEYSDSVSVPVLWDKQTRQIVNNSEDDICRMFNKDFAPLRNDTVDLFPADISAEQDGLSGFLFENITSGVYKAGFATTQAAYEKPLQTLFESLDELEERLHHRRYLFANRIVESDWRLFCTLLRFDAVYHGHFKCNLRRIADSRLPFIRLVLSSAQTNTSHGPEKSSHVNSPELRFSGWRKSRRGRNTFVLQALQIEV